MLINGSDVTIKVQQFNNGKQHGQYVKTGITTLTPSPDSLIRN